MKRRQALSAASSLLTAGLVTASHPVTASRNSLATSASTDEIRENGRVRYDPDGKRFVYTFEYDIPNNITELTIRVDALDREHLSVRQTRNVSRADATSFVWKHGRSPRLVIESQPSGTTFPAGVSRSAADSVGAIEPRLYTRLSFRYRGIAPQRRTSLSVGGEGFAGTTLVYGGPVATQTRSIEGIEVTIVTPDRIDVSVPNEELLEAYAFAEATITAQTTYDRKTVFVVPDRWGGNPGFAVGNDVVLHATGARVRDIQSTAMHEHVHTMFHGFGDRGAYWLTEAIAEYYGYLVALNIGAGTFDAFVSTVSTNRYRDAVLSDAASMQRSTADYRKGAHVLAALDAEIQRVSDGTATLNDALTTDDHDLTAYAGFEAAVVDTSGASTLAEWLDRYVRSEALPGIPRDPRYFVLGDRTPDDLQSTASARTDTVGPWETTVENDASVDGSETDLTIRVHRCSSGSATRAIDEPSVTISFDFEIEAELWWERPYVQILEDGVPIWEGSAGSENLYDERLFEIPASGVTRGRVQKTVSGTGPLQVRFGITPSGSCSAGDHGTTWFRVSNIEIQAPADASTVDEAQAATIETKTMTPTDPQPITDSAASTDNPLDFPSPSPSPTDAAGPGFGIGSAIGGLAGMGYLLSRWTDDE